MLAVLKKTGYSILNADDNLTYNLRQDLNCNIAFFSRFQSPRIRKHCAQGGLAAYVDNGNLIVQIGKDQQIVARIKDIPLSFKGTATCMILNLLPAILAGVISGFPLEKIKDALQVFYPTPENLPGRMNLFKFSHCEVMVDYAHNEGAFCEMKNYLEAVPSSVKIGIIGVAGDRRDEDIEALGYHSAQMFNEIIIRHDKDGRGRTNEEITHLLHKGIVRSGLKPVINIISDEVDAIERVIDRAQPDSFIFCAIEDVFRVTHFLKQKAKQLMQINEAYK